MVVILGFSHEFCFFISAQVHFFFSHKYLSQRAWGLNVNSDAWRDLYRKVLHATCQLPHTGTPPYSPQPIVSLFCLISFSKGGSRWLKCKLQYTAGRKRNLVVMVAGGMGAGSPTIKPGSCPPALFTAVVPAWFLCFLPTFFASCPFRAINLIRHR